MKKILKKFLFNPVISKSITRLLAKIHHISYSYLGIFASSAEGGIHPKHRLMRYKEWFLDNIKHGGIVLDVGCHTGLMTELMAQKASFVYGVEINDNLIKEARKTRPMRQLTILKEGKLTALHSPMSLNIYRTG
jgi:2-polyprenyl-3-methyl-5-hydroxy-6-metoxy-1,4-benzoquinol methylase